MKAEEEIYKCKGNTINGINGQTDFNWGKFLETLPAFPERETVQYHISCNSFKFDKVVILLLERCNNIATSWNHCKTQPS